MPNFKGLWQALWHKLDESELFYEFKVNSDWLKMVTSQPTANQSDALSDRRNDRSTAADSRRDVIVGRERRLEFDAGRDFRPETEGRRRDLLDGRKPEAVDRH